MTDHKIETREEWLAARLELLKAEKALTRRSDELAQWRQKLPWVRIDKEYRFETDEGMASLADLFRGRSQLLIYHFMFSPEYTGGCPACSSHSHIVVAHKIGFELLKTINAIDFVESIKGTYSGSGIASIGPVHER
jgi:predicted dithiol-disulfide oxidoreductase (DUF899 family)